MRRDPTPPTRSCSSARTRPITGDCTAPDLYPVSQGRHQRPRDSRRVHGESRPCRHQVRVLVQGHRGARANRRVAAPPSLDRRRAGPRDGRKRRPARRRIRRGDGRAEGRGRRVLRRAHTVRRRRRPGPGAPAGVRRHAVEQAASTTTCRGGWMGTQVSPRRRRRARPGGIRGGGTSTGSTSSRCQTNGNIPGSRRGIWRSTACRWPTSTPRSPSTSSFWCAGSGSRIRTGRCRPTSGTSAMSTRQCTHGRRCRCSPSTADAIWTSCPACSTSSPSTSHGG